MALSRPDSSGGSGRSAVARRALFAKASPTSRSDDAGRFAADDTLSPAPGRPIGDQPPRPSPSRPASFAAGAGCPRRSIMSNSGAASSSSRPISTRGPGPPRCGRCLGGRPGAEKQSRVASLPFKLRSASPCVSRMAGSMSPNFNARSARQYTLNEASVECRMVRQRSVMRRFVHFLMISAVQPYNSKARFSSKAMRRHVPQVCNSPVRM
mmetsp:Transcript_61551/g.177142  ORF Transcript_61551/g.177142 Transcript_61551/m.177142 type:complete len:210 (+) Transcript_61551:1504-2133(+)